MVAPKRGCFPALERRTLEGLAAEFAREVAERHAVDVLLSVRCERTALGAAADTVAGTAAEAIAGAAYFRGGAFVPYASEEGRRWSGRPTSTVRSDATRWGGGWRW